MMTLHRCWAVTYPDLPFLFFPSCVSSLNLLFFLFSPPSVQNKFSTRDRFSFHFTVSFLPSFDKFFDNISQNLFFFLRITPPPPITWPIIAHSFSLNCSVCLPFLPRFFLNVMLSVSKGTWRSLPISIIRNSLKDFPLRVFNTLLSHSFTPPL